MRRLVLAALLLASAPGCAFTDRDRLALTNLADRTLVSDGPVGQRLVGPLLVPLGILTMALDNLIVAPLANLPSAWRDTADFYHADVGGYFTENALYVPRVAIAPLVGLGSWFGRTVFGLDPDEEARWAWPEWGRRWVRDDDGRLLGSPDRFDRDTKEPLDVAPAPRVPPPEGDCRDTEEDR